MTKVIRRETRTRSPVGKVMKVVFILFNLVMIALMLVTCQSVGTVTSAANDTGGAAVGAGLAGAAIGGTILVFWALGTVVLGALTYFTRGPSVITEETVD